VSALAELFTRCRAEDRAALIAYLPSGFPSHDDGVAAMLALLDAGVDAIEVGLPYSDPVMDGPTIQQAADAALQAGSTTKQVLATVEAVASSGAPVVVMSYWNPVERYGVEPFARDLAAAGGAGLITPDLIPDEAPEWIEASAAAGLDRIFLVAPSSSDDRLAMTAAACTGFIYATSVMGVTGTREQASAAGPELVERLRAVTELPVGIGLGVSNAEQAADVAGYADAVIVGSALVRRLLDAPTSRDGIAHAAELATELAAGVRSGKGAQRRTVGP
jgi:tryptophan synthase alpha chain